MGRSIVETNAQTFLPDLVWQARACIRRFILPTPLVFSAALSRRSGCQVYLKMECWQLCGCFKVRGALNKTISLAQAASAQELVTASSGNHGIGLAYAASLFENTTATIFLPQDADLARLERIRQLGAQIILHGNTYAEAYDRALDFAAERGASYVHSHADPLVMAGQGTIGLEIIEDLPDPDAVIVPIGGGGLISGVSTAIKANSPETRIIGVEPLAAPAAYLSMQDGVCRERIDPKPSIADGLLGGVGRLPFEVFRSLIEDVALVGEEEIIEAMRAFQDDEQLMLEPAACVGLAAILSGKIELSGQKVVLIVTSRNIGSKRFNRLVNEPVK